MTDLERTISMFKQQQPQQPQQPQIPQFQPQAPAPNVDLQKILAVINAQQQMSQPPAFQQPLSQPAVNPNFAAIVSQLSNQNTAGAQPSPFHEDPDRKRMRERDAYEDAFDDRFNPSKRHKQPGLMKHVSCPSSKHIRIILIQSTAQSWPHPLPLLEGRQMHQRR